MDFLDPKKKRTQKIRLFAGYGLMAALITIGTVFLWFFSFGFNFDPKTNSVVQNGLVFVDSHPESARVFVNGADKGETDTRMVLPAGDYDLELRRDGYRTWKHKISLEGGLIERLVYPFMFPEKLVSEDAELFSATPSLASQSPDRKWLIVQQSPTINNFTVMDLSVDNIEPKPLIVPEAVLTKAGAKHELSPAEWSTDNKHLVVKHVFDTGVEFILLDREAPEKAVNLNKYFARNISDLALRDKKFNRYYLHDSATGDLVFANLESKEITPVASQVTTFQPHGADIVMFVSSTGQTKDSVSVKIKDGDNLYVLRELPKSSKYLIDLAQFSGKWYIAAGSADDQRVYVYIDPFDDLKRKDGRKATATALLRLNSRIEYLSFSANARFIAAQGGSNFAVYDAENKRQFRYDTKLPLEKNQEATWMDGHRITLISEGKLVILDFDGANKQTLIGVSSNKFLPFFDRDYNNLFTVSPSTTVKNKPALVHTKMRYEPENTN